MSDTMGSRSLLVYQVTEAPRSDARSVDGFELRTIGLGVAANLLHMSVADFDCVRLAAAMSDTMCCPVCRPGRRRAV